MQPLQAFLVVGEDSGCSLYRFCFNCSIALSQKGMVFLSVLVKYHHNFIFRIHHRSIQMTDVFLKMTFQGFPLSSGHWIEVGSTLQRCGGITLSSLQKEAPGPGWGHRRENVAAESGPRSPRGSQAWPLGLAVQSAWRHPRVPGPRDWTAPEEQCLGWPLASTRLCTCIYTCAHVHVYTHSETRARAHAHTEEIS